MEQAVELLFQQTFQRSASALFRSPGRVNLIGEHTDYNEGFVLPASVDRAIDIAIAPRRDDRIRLFAADLALAHEAKLATLDHSPEGWPNYFLGVVDQLQKQGCSLSGFDCVFGGNVPIGAGMSSSAAIEGGLAYALNETLHLGLEPLQLVRLAQRAENEFVGVRCGIMDQFINIFGKSESVVRLDCRSMEFEYVPFARADIRIVLCDTKVRRALAGSEYNIRRGECERGVKILQQHDGSIRSLRDISAAFLDDHRREIDPTTYRRCAFVVGENERVLMACHDLKVNDFRSFGDRMSRSHASLRDEYEVSCPELDLLVEIASRCRGVYGSRMMGAGFGGCTINLVDAEAVQGFSESIEREYREKTGLTPDVHTCTIQAGTHRVELVDSASA